VLANVKTFLVIAALSGGLAVMLGAFGAHGLKGTLAAPLLATFQTAVQYQFYHSLALLLVAVLMHQGLSGGWITASAVLFALGMVFFCGSLYALALGGPRWLGPVTPLGGLMFIAGWGALLMAVLSTKNV